MQRNRRLTPSLLLVITALGLLRTPEVFAADPGGLDLVVLVDQSGSMSGHGTPAKNDPYNVRNHMVAFTLDLMAENAVLNQVNHRLGVVSFGTTVRVDLPLSKLDADNLENLRGLVRAISSEESLGHTNFLAAFQAAAKMFADLPPGPERKRTILVITDGAPYVEGIRITEYTAELRDFAAEHFPQEEYLIQVVALNDPTSDYWDRYRSFWREITDNHAKKLEGDENDVFAALHEVVTELVRTRVVRVVEEKIVIPPYLESIVFDIFSVDPSIRVDICSPEDPNTPLSPDSPGVKVVRIGEIIRSVTIRRPAPGPWTVRKSDSDARVDVFNQQFFP
ncbi:MAG: VWA domain-containing protein, partial [bacterium]|nr:VWA domain-containing protein [bacterium]